VQCCLTTMLLLLLLIGGSYGQDLLTPVEAVPTPAAPDQLNLRNDTPEPLDSDSESEEPREGKSIASPIPPPLAHPPPFPGAIFRDSPVVHPALPHDALLAAGPPPPPLAGGPPPPPAPPIFHDSPVVHPAPPPPPPPAPEPVYTDRKCRIEQIELLAEVCLPTIVKDCGPVALKERRVEGKESCVEVARTVCTESEESVDNELCYYTYTDGQVEGEVKSVDVSYDLKCEDAPSHYGHGYGKDQSKVCYNKPKLSPATSSITLETPVPEKQCENRPVMLPRVKCEEVVEKRCFQLPSADLDSTTLEKCSTQLGAPKCRQVPVKLPRQVCSRVIPVPKPAPVVHHAVHQPVVHHAVHQPIVHHAVHQPVLNAPHHGLHHGVHHGVQQQPLQHAALASGPAHSFINLAG